MFNVLKHDLGKYLRYLTTNKSSFKSSKYKVTLIQYFILHVYFVTICKVLQGYFTTFRQDSMMVFMAPS